MKNEVVLSLVLGAAFLLCACAGEESGSGSGSVSSSSGAGGGGGEGQGGNQGAGGSGGGGGAIGSGGGGGAPPMGELVPKLKSMDMYIDCQPIVPPDPVHGSYAVDYDTTGASGPVSATITSSKLTFGQPGGSFTFDVDPSGTGLLVPGAVIQLMHKKNDDTLSGTGEPCNFCNGVWSLEVTFDVNGKAFSSSLPSAPVSCVF